ncbi:MAG TPA: HAMP domain-containing sensor histidine kinase [Deinococcales bacterium]|nr:HAMP domain-containing sensor histidine kinase [Deinococcales bacterium]
MNPGAGRAARLPALQARLLASHLLVVLVAGAALLLAADLSAPVFYAGHMQAMSTVYAGPLASRLNAELQAGFTSALGRALLLAGLLAFPAALLVSLFVTRRLARPISDVAQASARMAAGQWAERLPGGGVTELAEMTDSFNTMAAALQEAERRRAELIGTVAHELRTPLSGLRGYLEGLSDGVFDAATVSANAGRELARLERLVDDLTLLHRAEAHELPVAVVPGDLREAALEARERLLPLFEAKGLSLTVAGEAAPARFDPDRLQQVLANLLGNARRHTARGGVTLTAGTSNGWATLDVTDTGEGIPEADRPFIFDRFFRGDRSRSHPDGETVGIGVGLTVSRHLVGAMNGTLEALPSPAGARFRIALPAA